MPEPLPAGASTQTEQNAGTPSTPAATKDKQTTTQTESDLMDALGIPRDVQAKIGKADRVKEQGSNAATEPELKPDAAVAEASQPTEEKASDTDALQSTLDDEGDDDDEGEEAALQSQPQKPDKRQKRINRLTRQKSVLEDENAQLRERIDKAEAKKAPDTDALQVPSATGRLAHITDERKLNEEVARSEAVIDWCDANSEGAILTEEQLEPKFKQAYSKGELTLAEATTKTVANWKSEAEKVVRSASNRRDEIRTYSQQRTWFDNASRTAWPEMFDKKTPEYQLKNALLEEYPWIKGTAQENYLVGIAIEGMKSLKGRAEQANGQKPGSPIPATTRRDISPRAFEPRVPIAPTTPEPPTREPNAVSSTKKVNEAMNALVKDADGGVGSLAAVLRAEEEAAGATKAAGSRTPVKV